MMDELIRISNTQNLVQFLLVYLEVTFQSAFF
jgi:hypothetical protein